MDIASRRTALHRLYDQSGGLLYIGISHQPDVRFAQHSTDKPWWSDVARRDVQWHADRATAAQAEAEAVRRENPEHNRTYSPRRRYSAHDSVAGDGVRELSLTLARAQFTTLIEDARERDLVTALTVRGRRRICLVTPEFYERAMKALGEQPAS
ncbi:hypothetical protein [Streptomyces sp. ITFR-6]|uniref:hypothetical protein n=1 Tax=Streptomyces sp. ITFR-6 TaxID=3075197 RepID=UPI00288BE433|nr:hypothetical protein [Streptomyces sp. ITFR-6]WNI31465.1 hypothetical protein RLT59_23750 [Streptomyces sp. ITFR-6]